MNLMKLINFNFIKENIKKSLGILLFLFFIIPIVNILYLFNMLNQQIYVINLIDLTKMTYFASFIFPVVIAYILNNYLLYNTLSDHGLYDLLKSGNICTCYIVSRYSVSFSCICCLCEDVDHDLVQSLINFFKGPGQS